MRRRNEQKGLSSEALLSESEEENDDIEKNLQSTATSRRRFLRIAESFYRPLHIVFKIIQIGFSLYGVATLIFPLQLSLQNHTNGKADPYGVSYDEEWAATFDKHPCDCDDSVAEELSNGCIYDELSAAWLPDRCREDSITAEFAALGDGPGCIGLIRTARAISHLRRYLDTQISNLSSII
ncbi:hypothetical protein N7488_000050 [Penicillium malachiteum]|nr:hypothetical protein N7488_000050 [Penicillium malachiteum]